MGSTKLILALRVFAGCLLVLLGGSLTADIGVAPGLPEAALIDLLLAIVALFGGFMVLRGARRSMNLNEDGTASRRPFRTRRWDIAVAALLFLLPVGTSQASRNADGSSAGSQLIPTGTVPVVDHEAAAGAWVSAVSRRATSGSNLEARMEHCRDSEECIEAVTRMFDGACRILVSEGSEAATQAIRDAFSGTGLGAAFAAEDEAMLVEEFAEAIQTSC